MRRCFLLPAAALSAIGIAACTGQASFRASAEDFIEQDDGDVAEALSVTFADASCEEPPNEAVGTVFTCTAVGSDGQTYSFQVEITSETQFTIREGTPPTPGTAPAATMTTVPGAPVATTVPGTAPGTAPATVPPTSPPASG